MIGNSPYGPGEKDHPCKKESEILDRKIIPAKSYERKIKFENKSLHRIYINVGFLLFLCPAICLQKINIKIKRIKQDKGKRIQLLGNYEKQK